MCSASMNSAPCRFASTANWRPTLDPISHETRRRASLGGSKTLFIVPPPELDLSHQEPPQVFLVDGLACDAKGFGHLRPRPARPHGPLDLGVLEPIGDRSQCRRSRQAVSRTADWRGCRWHVSNSSCLFRECQPWLLNLRDVLGAIWARWAVAARFVSCNWARLAPGAPPDQDPLDRLQHLPTGF